MSVCVCLATSKQIKYIMLEEGQDQGKCRAGAGGSKVLPCIRPFRRVWLRGASRQSLESNKTGSSPAGRGAVQRPWGRTKATGMFKTQAVGHWGLSRMNVEGGGREEVGVIAGRGAER